MSKNMLLTIAIAAICSSSLISSAQEVKPETPAVQQELSAPAYSSPKNIKASNGDFTDQIRLFWDEDLNLKEFDIYRAATKDGNYDKIGSVKKKEIFFDKNIQPGYEYYYKIIFKPESTEPLNSDQLKGVDTISGFARFPLPKTPTLESVILKKNKAKPQPKDDAEKEKIAKITAYLKPHLINRVKLQVVFKTSNPHFKEGTLKIFSDFDTFRVLEENNEVQFDGPNGTYMVILNANRLFRVLSETQNRELFDTLVKNGIAFCVYSGDRAIPEADGRIKHINIFEAIGLATTYFKYDSNWQNETILFGTSKDYLRDKMREIQREEMKKRRER